MNFTDSQKQAIDTTTGNVLVIASAGSGKTAVFTNRIVKMIQDERIEPNRILGVTFTKKASEEMRTRLAKLTGDEIAQQVTMGTFHSISYHLLKTAYPLYRKKEFAKDWWILKTINSLCDEPSDKNPYGLEIGLDKVKDVVSYIERMKNTGYFPNDENAKGYNMVYNRAYESFEILKNNANYITMSDLIIDFFKMLNEDKKFSDYVGSLYDRVQIDEFQDTSELVLNCIKHINKKNVMVVGDFRQSIFSFIGANVNNILEFPSEFENVKVIELQDNFRSSENIVDFSNKIIEKSQIENYKRFKPSKAFKGLNEDVVSKGYLNEEEEALDIVNQVQKRISEGAKLNEIAVLLRTNSQIGIYEEIFNERNIKCDVSKDGSFFNYGEIIDIISYLRLAVNKRDNTSVRRVINRPTRYVSNKLISEIDVHAKTKNMTLLESLNNHPSATRGYQAKNIQEFLYVVEELTKAIYNYNLPAHRVVAKAIEITSYKQYIKDTSMTKEKEQNKLENLGKLIKIAKRFSDVSSFLKSIDVMELNRKETKREGVQLMTIHKSKGLEFDCVYVPALVEGVLPHTKSAEGYSLEEERRLFYVACSRAREQLQVSTYKEKYEVNESGEITSTEKVSQSRFFKEIVAG